MLESQLSGRTAVRSLEPSKVEMIPFWSTFRIMVASTKYMSPFLSTAMPDQDKQWECVSWRSRACGGRGGDVLVGITFLDQGPYWVDSQVWSSGSQPLKVTPFLMRTTLRPNSWGCWLSHHPTEE